MSELPQTVVEQIREALDLAWKYGLTALTCKFSTSVAEFIENAESNASFICHIRIISISSTCQSSSNIAVMGLVSYNSKLYVSSTKLVHITSLICPWCWEIFGNENLSCRWSKLNYVRFLTFNRLWVRIYQGMLTGERIKMDIRVLSKEVRVGAISADANPSNTHDWN